MKTKVTSIVMLAGLLAVAALPAAADPLDDQILKFQQLPLDGLTIDANVYYGHDELSTAYSHYSIGATGVLEFDGFGGKFMADDFGDRFNTPVLHVRWWGSYLNDEIIQPVDKFLIAFESDVPAGASSPGWSHPGSVLSSQIITKVAAGPLAPGSGTYTEKLITGVPPAAESLYEYNGELAIPFDQDPNTVYWLKIVALVDLPPGGDPALATKWGWHDRDWSVRDPLASTVADGVVPGEYIQGLVAGVDANYPVWHFQDDAVSGGVFIAPGADANIPLVIQDWVTFRPERYIDGVDGPTGIGEFSKDLAFELYTIPEPATLTLVGVGMAFVAVRRRKRSRA